MSAWATCFLISWSISQLFFGVDKHLPNGRKPIVTETKSAGNLFESDSILEVVIEGDINKLLRDRFDDAVKHPLTLTYTTDDNKKVVVPIEAKTRGHFRRTQGDCTYPPLMLHFRKNDSTDNSIFNGQSKLKLVVPCRSEELIIKEWMAYKMYNLLTPQSFKVRLLNLQWKQSNKNKQEKPIYAFLLENEDEMAARNGSFSVKRNHLSPTATDSSAFFRMAIFQYLIGNTDWSIQYMQNIKLITTDTNSVSIRPVTVPYDFDMSGWVNAPYGKPAPELMLASIKTRRFRGYCIPNTSVYDETLKQFEDVKTSIYQLLETNAKLSQKTISVQKEFLDQFYTMLSKRDRLDRDLLYPCDKNGTGNVVIRGLNVE
ncbi:hypothetical protein [Pollutibacter soli]|uniref:hypothetical protein n=1 Tax=Pollutibacter soli TaxID=3034157 RepID=UPI00301343C3